MHSQPLSLAVGGVLLFAGAASAATVTDYLNLRTGPGTSYDVIVVMPVGSEIVVSRCSASWCRVVWNAAKGYAFRDFISSGEPVYPGPLAGGAEAPYSPYYGGVAAGAVGYGAYAVGRYGYPYNYGYTNYSSSYPYSNYGSNYPYSNYGYANYGSNYPYNYGYGAIAGGAIAASRPRYGYGGYGYDHGSSYYGYNPGYSTSDSTGTDYDLGYYGWYPGHSTGYSTSGGQDVAYCAQRFRSYDPGSGTYLGYDGQRHPCP
jgi:hypothetical protein